MCFECYLLRQFECLKLILETILYYKTSLLHLMNKTMTAALLVLLLFFIGFVYADTSVSQYGITWTFDNDYTIGQFANGDYWVLGPVTITAITPSFDGSRNGWEVNPVVSGGQGFDNRIAPYSSFDSGLIPSLPYVAQPGESIVKTVSADVCDPNTSYVTVCLETAAVLTVLSVVPPDNGATVFRPPYVGTDKTLYSTISLRTDLLPVFSPVSNTPTFEELLGIRSTSWGTLYNQGLRYVQLDHKQGQLGRNIHPMKNIPNYGADIGQRNGDAALRLMLNDSIDDKRELLIAFTQYGIDLYHMALIGHTWPDGGGQRPGQKLPLVFAATLLDNQSMKSFIANSSFLHEDLGLSISRNGMAVFGFGAWVTGDPEYGYWNIILTGSGNKSLPDPYGFIDGGYRPGNQYDYCCVAQPWKGAAISLHLLPEMQEAWGDSFLFFEYTDRWVNFGAWTQEDPCAPVSQGGGSDGSGWCVLDPDLEYYNGPNDFACQAGRECGRFPERHGISADDGTRYSAFQAAMWGAYRGASCYNGVCESGETASNCSYDCITCTPDCTGKECGDDGCGGYCGSGVCVSFGDYYVAKTGCSDSNPGTEANPWCTIQKAADTVKGSAVVIVEPGTYDERVTIPSTGGGDVSGKLIFKTAVTDSVKMQGFKVLGDYTRIEDFNITHNLTAPVSNRDGIYIYADHVEVVDNYVYDLRNTYGISTEWRPSNWKSDILIEGNTIERCNAGLTIKGYDITANNNVVYDLRRDASGGPNTSSDADYSRFAGENIVISNNKFYGTHHDNVNDAIATSHTDGFQSYHNNDEYAKNVFIENNFVASADQIVFIESDTDFEDIYVRNNIFADAENDGFEGTQGVKVYGVKNLQVINNTFAFLDNIATAFRKSKSSLPEERRQITTGKIINNIYYNCTGSYWADGNSTYEAKTNNTFGSPDGDGLGDEKGDPLFENANEESPAVSGFKLKIGSGAIDKGTDTSAQGVTDDFEGNQRPRGTAYDIGAYESFGAVCTPNCTGKECGDNGCNGSCGSCGTGEICIANQCVSSCTPDCSGKECGSDSCGGTCGTCESEETCASGSCVAITVPDLQLYLKFDDSIDDRLATDSSGKNLDGSCTSCPEYYSSGHDEGAYLFDGLQQSLNTSVVPLDYSQGLTFTVWINPNRVDSRHDIVGHRSNDTINSEGYTFFRIYEGAPMFGIYEGVWHNAYSSLSISDSSWQFVAVVYDGSSVTYYVNGTSETISFDYFLPNVNEPFIIGRHPTLGWFFDGYMDNLRVYNKALTSLEIQSLYSGGQTCTTSQIFCDDSCIDPVCSSDLDCSDSNSWTVDSCLDADSCDSACVNIVTADCGEGAIVQQCACINSSTGQPALYNSGFCCGISQSLTYYEGCYTNEDCLDGDDLTTDSCVNFGTCQSYCQHSCNIACVADLDCDDSNSLTTDSCHDAGSCSAICSNIVSALCGNSEINDGENCSSCPADVLCEEGKTCSSGSCIVPQEPNNTKNTSGGGGGGGSGGGDGCLPTLADRDGDCVKRDKDCNDYVRRVGECVGCQICFGGECVDGVECSRVTGNDSDGDSITDEEEGEQGTNPLDVDSDNDLVCDDQELKDGTDPLDANSNKLSVSISNLVVGETAKIFVVHPELGSIKTKISADVTYSDGSVEIVQSGIDGVIKFVPVKEGKVTIAVSAQAVEFAEHLTVSKSIVEVPDGKKVIDLAGDILADVGNYLLVIVAVAGLVIIGRYLIAKRASRS